MPRIRVPLMCAYVPSDLSPRNIPRFMSGGKGQREQFLVPPSTVNGYKKGRVGSTPRTRSDTDFQLSASTLCDRPRSLCPPPPHHPLPYSLSFSLSLLPISLSLSLISHLYFPPPPPPYSLSVSLSLCAPLSPFFLCSTLDAELKVPHG